MKRPSSAFQAPACRLLLFELKKLWSMPMLPAFLILCLLFNLFLLTGDRIRGDYMQGSPDIGSGDYIRFSAQVSQRIGSFMGPEFDRALAEAGAEIRLPAVAAGINGRTATAHPDRQTAKQNAGQTALTERLIADTYGASDQLEGFDTSEIGAFYIDRYQISGAAADLLGEKYRRLQDSVDRLARKDASLSLFAASATKPLVDSLLCTALRALFTEGALLAVLLALYSCGCEDLWRTTALLATTKTGRRLYLTKAAASALSALAAYGTLSLCTVAGFALLWHMAPGQKAFCLWNGQMSSQFYYITVLLRQMPFLTWHPFTAGEYLTSALLLGAVLILIFHGTGVLIGCTVRNMYRGFLLFFSAAALNFLLPALAGDRGHWLFYQLLQWTPLPLWWSSPLWFTDMGPNAILPWQECASAAVCLVAAAALSLPVHRRVQKRDL